jgi:hypothetical protein
MGFQGIDMTTNPEYFQDLRDSEFDISYPMSLEDADALPTVHLGSCNYVTTDGGWGKY